MVPEKLAGEKIAGEKIAGQKFLKKNVRFIKELLKFIFNKMKTSSLPLKAMQ